MADRFYSYTKSTFVAATGLDLEGLLEAGGASSEPGESMRGCGPPPSPLEGGGSEGAPPEIF